MKSTIFVDNQNQNRVGAKGMFGARTGQRIGTDWYKMNLQDFEKHCLSLGRGRSCRVLF